MYACIEDVRLLAGKKNPEVKKVIIMGGSRIALRACQYLPNNIRVKVIETDKEKSYRIAEAVPGNVLIINGDGRDMDLLMHEGIQDAQDARRHPGCTSIHRSDGKFQHQYIGLSGCQAIRGLPDGSQD